MNNQRAKLDYETYRAKKREDRSSLIRLRWYHLAMALLFASIARVNYHEHSIDKQLSEVIYGGGMIWFTYVAVMGWWSNYVKSDRLDWIPLFVWGSIGVLVGVVAKDLPYALLGIFMVTKGLIDYTCERRNGRRR